VLFRSYSNHYSLNDPNPTLQKFVKAYTERYGHSPDALGALGYDSANMLIHAIQSAGVVDSTKIRDALAQTKDFDGVTGKITIDADRNPTKPAVVLRVKDGKLEFVETVNP